MTMSNGRTGVMCWLTATMLCFGISSAIWAEEVPVEAAVSDGALEEVVVTAEKVSTNLQKAPAAITVVDAQTLDIRGIEDLNEAQVLLPSARIGHSAVGTQVIIRGVGQKTDAPNTDPLAVVNMDGIPVPREAIAGSNLFDVERLEALPGPQGTLYGSTAIGGVINVETKQPSQTAERDIEVEGGNYSHFRVTAALDEPLSPIVSARLAVNYNREDGYLTSGAGAIDDRAARLAVKVDPTDQLSLLLWGSALQSRGTTPNTVTYPFADPSNPYYDTPAAAGPVKPFVGDLHNDVYILSGKLDYEVAGLKISYIPSYLKTDSFMPFYYAANSFDISSNDRQHTNELRVANDPASSIRFVGGIYESSLEYIDFLALRTTSVNFDVPDSKLTNLSAYAQGTYSVTDAFRVTLGARYGTNKRTATVDEAQRGVIHDTFDFDRRYYHTDWKFGVDYDVIRNSMAYAVIQTGYAPGTYTFTPSTPGVKPDLDPTTLLSYTLGIKNRFFDQRLQLNVEGFYYDYKDLLVSALNSLTGNNQFYNAQVITIYGTEVDAAWAIDRATELRATVGYLHARNTDFTVPQVPPHPTLIYTGLTPVFSPEWTANLGASHVFDVSGGSTITFRVDSHIETSSWGQFDHAPGTLSPKYTKTDLGLTYEPPSAKWHLSAWVRNVENSVHFTALTAAAPGKGDGFLERPRTYGATAGIKF